MPLRTLIAWLLIGSSALAAEPVESRGLMAPVVKTAPGEQPVQLASYALDVRVHGLFAHCTATMTFLNPNRRPLEGDLEFPLADRATVCGYALDIAGRMVDGVVVGKDRGRVILESEARRRVDPGLVEQVRGNLFRTRVTPIPAQGQRTIAVEWIEDLTVQGDEAALRVPLPRCVLPTLTMHVEIVSGEAEPRLSGFGNLTLTRWHERRQADATLSGVTPDDDLLIRLPALPHQLVTVEDDQDESFVAIDDRPVFPARAAAAPPRHLAVAWDASSSRTPAGIAQGRAFLQALLARCPGCVIDLVVFRDVVEVPLVCADAAALATALDHCVYDGGTALSRLDLSRAALPHPEDRSWILVSDGFGTIGEGLPKNGDVPVFCVAAESERDLALLRLLAARSGGEVIDPAVTDAAIATSLVIDPPPRLLRVEAPAGIVGDIDTDFSAGCATVVAKYLHAGAIDLVYGSAGRELLRDRVQVGPNSSALGGILARAWAGRRAQELGVDAEANRAELIALGRRYHLVTPGTSLLVLEGLDQYLRYQIMPPASSPGLRDQYLSMLKDRRERWQADDAIHLDAVVGWWRQRVAWWQQPRLAVKVSDGGQGLFGSTAPDRITELNAPPVARLQGREEAVEGETDAAVVQQRMEAVTGSADAFSAIGAGGGSAGLFGARSGAGWRRALAHSGGTVAEEAAEPSASVDAILITPFDPATPYLRAMKEAPGGDAYAAYLSEREVRRSSPSFYLDCAGFMLAHDQRLGRRILSNLAELRIDDPSLLRVFAWRLEQAGDVDQAVAALRRVLRLRPEEPQSYRDLALALARRAEAAGSGADLSEAMALLHRVVLRHPMEDAELGDAQVVAQAWSRFPEVEVIALEELNRLLVVAGRRSWDRAPTLPPLDERLKQAMDCDLRVVMSWDADATDIDLHVVEPGGEEAFYGHQRTVAGGLVSSDMRQGYGPEEYLMRRAADGLFRVNCQFYGSSAQRLLGPATVTAQVITDWGRPTERRQMLTLRLDRQGDAIQIGAVTIARSADGASIAPGDSIGSPVTIGQLKNLIAGQKLTAVTAALGPPVRVDHDALTVLEYRTVNGTTARLGFGPDLLWAREILDGAEHELLAR